MTIDTEIARRNYALTVNTFDVENFLQISCGDEILVTVCAPAGPSIPNQFVVFNGTGLDEDDNDLDISEAAKVFKVKTCVGDAWREAARHGYLHALSKLMIPDSREDREAYDFAA